MQYRIKSSGETFPTNELHARFPNVSFPTTLSQADLDAFNLEYVQDPAPTAEQLAAQLVMAKTAKNTQINQWRAQANQTYFAYSGKQIACDALSRSDIDAVAGSISLTGAFPVGFPNAWKAMDNTYVPIPDVDTFKDMYAAMTLQGTINFGRSQTLKGQLAVASTVEQVNAIAW